MASKPEEPKAASLSEASRQCRRAIEDCDALLRRTDEMLRRSQQDNGPRHPN